jgi:hypothetical protein
MPNFAAEFAARYQRAGAPRIMVLWNAELTPRAATEWVVRENASASSSRNGSRLTQSSAGPEGASTIVESNANAKGETHREISLAQREDARRSADLSERAAIELQHAFETRLREGSATLIDYALSVRTTALTQPGTADTNVRTLEAAALRNKTDLVLQVLLVPDQHAASGYGFDVSVRHVVTGASLVAFYTRALPPAPPTVTRYVATDRGFERKTIVMGKQDIRDIGAALANELMNELGPVLSGAAPVPSGKRR